MTVRFQERPWVNSILGYSLDITLFSFIIVEPSATVKWMLEFFSYNNQKKSVHSLFQWDMPFPFFLGIYLKSIYNLHLQWWCVIILIVHHLIIFLSPNQSSILASLQCWLCMTPERTFKTVLIIPQFLPNLVLVLNTFLGWLQDI